ncbi:hypothetical protein TNCV_1547871 [Trichonephila clavipes]|nr:hypothetical protein TNCV_1547871 [Trichonephila clavipes]
MPHDVFFTVKIWFAIKVNANVVTKHSNVDPPDASEMDMESWWHVTAFYSRPDTLAMNLNRMPREDSKK